MDIKQKLKCFVDYELSTLDDREELVSFTVHIEKDCYKSAVTSGNTIDYIAKNLKRHVRKAGVSVEDLWFALELHGESGFQKPHVHGGLRIKASDSLALSMALQNALGKTQRKSAARKKSIKQIYSSGWIDYCFKNVDKVELQIDRSPIFMTHRLRNKISNTFGKTYTKKIARKPSCKRGEAGLKGDLSSYGSNLNNNASKSLQTTSVKTIHGLLKALEIRKENLRGKPDTFRGLS